MSDRVVFHMGDRRPVWAPPEWVAGEIRDALPVGWELVVPDAPSDGSGDGAALAHPAVLEAVEGARVYLGMGIPDEVLRAGEELEWVHSGAAGVGGSLGPEMRARDVLFTNSAGIHAAPMADTVLAMTLHFTRGLDFAVRAQGRGRWSTGPFYEARTPVTELVDCVVGILGYGGVGREVAKRFSALGVRVLALRRHPAGGDDPHAEVLHGAAGLARVLGRSDVLVLCLPETEETRGLLDAEALEAMKEGAILINVARGGVVDEAALIEALRSGRIRGAGLDVFSSEPLPDGHPLWDLPNVLITPHVSAVTRRFWRRQVDLIVENLERFLEGRELVNRVNKEAGY
ncbi:MAG TPA: D-2-hydroxyacid dehydrogenase [Longimicrobiales bacterium]|nr:D-2-hydroxyacid dehydrogenase [Longimicrobiales bacterium]